MLGEYSWSQIFIVSSIFPCLFPVTVSLGQFKRLTAISTWLVWLSVITFFLSALSLGLWFRSENNLFIGHFHVIIQTMILLKISHIVFRGEGIEKWVSRIIWLFAASSVGVIIFFEPLLGFNAINRLISALLMVSISLYYFYKALSQTAEEKFEKRPMFWLNSAVLIYYFCTQSLFVFTNYIMDNKILAIPVWVLHSILFWIFFILCSIAVWVSLRRTQ